MNRKSNEKSSIFDVGGMFYKFLCNSNITTCSFLIQGHAYRSQVDYIQNTLQYFKLEID